MEESSPGKTTPTDYPIPNSHSENTHASNIAQTRHIVFRNICVYKYSYMYAATINEKNDMILKRSRSGIWKDLEEEERAKSCNYIIISKNERSNKKFKKFIYCNNWITCI